MTETLYNIYDNNTTKTQFISDLIKLNLLVIMIFF